METKRGVFISHISEEKAVALELQRYLKLAFGEDFPIFVASDQRSIGGGREWWNYIRRNCKEAGVRTIGRSHSAARPSPLCYTSP